jgi:hypothetical protein
VNRSGARLGRCWRVIIAAVLLVCLFVLSSCIPVTGGQPEPTRTPTLIPDDVGEILVYVYDGVSQSSVNEVVARVTNSSVVDGSDHRELRLASCDPGQFLVVSAPGYETHFTPCNGSSAYYIALMKINAVDNINYSWSSAYSNCGTCHAGQLGEGYNEVQEWEQSSHARVFADPFFSSIYRGTNVNGHVTTSTENYGPGFKLNYPDQAGDCAYCHAPAAILPSMEPTDLTTHYPRSAGVNGEGVTCDVCHKVSGVLLEDEYPSPDKPGIKALQFLRVSNSFVFGPFTNILLPANDGSQKHSISSCSPVLSKSELCAACHYRSFNDVPIYNSYGEWKESKYGRNPRNAAYKTCQDCHMSHMDVKNDTTPLSLRSACSETMEEYQSFDHNLMDVGPIDSGEVVPRLIRNAASLKVKLTYEPDQDNSLNVRVEVENKKAGHKFPTDSPLRHLILVVTATDQFGFPLAQVSGEQLPDWAGMGSQNGVEGHAGRPGIIFANLLVEETTNKSPTASYWNQIKYAFTTEDGKNSDTRLVPGEPQVNNFSFAVPDFGEMHITVELIYRYAFFDLMDQKDWMRPDVVVAVADCRMLLEQGDKMDCPEIEP